MDMIKNIIMAIGYGTFNQGAHMFCAMMNSLAKKGRKKMENYLVVSNNCVLSLPLSLSLSHRSGLIFLFISSHACARGAPCDPPCRQRNCSNFPLSFFVCCFLKGNLGFKEKTKWHYVPIIPTSNQLKSIVIFR